MPRSATLSPSVARGTFASGPYETIIDVITDEIHSPANVSIAGLHEEEVLLSGSLVLHDVTVEEGVIVLTCAIER